MQIGIKSLGCPKNFVDTEVICGTLREKGYQISGKIDNIIKGVLQGEQIYKARPEPKFLYNHNTPRTILTPRHYAYIKISEGCQNNCSYCLIPQIRGNYRSRKMEDIIEEVKMISENQNLSEIILIGQDTTLYGIDLYGEYKLAELLKKLSLLELNNLKWIS